MSHGEGTFLIAFPFRLNMNGSVMVQEDVSDEYLAGELAVLAMTIPGSRELVPEYGVIEPTFDALGEVEFVNQVALFGPPVTIESIEAEYTSESELAIVIQFDTVDNFAGSSFVDDDEEAEFLVDEGV